MNSLHTPKNIFLLIIHINKREPILGSKNQSGRITPDLSRQSTHITTRGNERHATKEEVA